MEATTRQRLGASFERGSEAYAANRPTYPRDAVRWLVGGGGLDVLDLGAGTGSLTAPLTTDGHRVTAAEPSRSMIRALVADNRSVPAVQSRAEQLPFTPGSFDVVTVATAFHWFDAAAALPQIAAVLRPRGWLSLVWNSRVVAEGGWPGELDQLLRSAQPGGLEGHLGTASVARVVASPLFGEVEQAEFPFNQTLDRDGLVGLVASRSYVISLEPDRRSQLFARVGRLFDATVADNALDRPATGEPATVELPYRVRCWRAYRR